MRFGCVILMVLTSLVTNGLASTMVAKLVCAYPKSPKSPKSSKSKSALYFGVDTVRFVIDMRKALAQGIFKPPTDSVGIRGGVPPLEWGKTLLAKDPDGTGLYKATVIFKPSSNAGSKPLYTHKRVPYKFKIESPNAKGNEGWEYGDNSNLLLGKPLTTLQRAFNEIGRETVPSTRSGTIIVHQAVPSSVLPPRTLVVYLPPNYAKDTSTRYPVLYMHDGQNVFDDSTASGTEWHLDEIAEALIQRKELKPCIIVGVYNTADRVDEYTPTQQVRPVGNGATKVVGGKAALYATMLVSEIKPFIDKTYRTLPDAANTAIGGSSLGGLNSLFLAMNYPHIFGHALVVSPSLWWDNKLLVEQMFRLEKKLPVRFWLSMGTQEGAEAIEDVRRLRLVFENLQWKKDTEYQYVEDFGGRHDEVSWSARAEAMLKFLFPAR
jgi:predicted alpha/beta superfamily hydrolase